jgi:hypothetical protein
VLLVVGGAACDRRAPERATVTTAEAAAPPLVSAAVPDSAPPTPWDAILGAVVATPAMETGAPIVFTRDTATTSGALDVDLFNHDAQSSRATLTLGALRPASTASTASCLVRRDGAIAGGTGTAPVVWSLALATGRATSLGIDALGDLAPKDSVRVAATVSRLVGALPDDSAAAPFRGLPIVVRDAWRAMLPDSTPIIVAVAIRTLNIESSPRAQVVTLIAEPDRSSGADAWRTVFARRAAGPEDQVEGADLLAALRLSAGPVIVALVRERETGLEVEFVERLAPGAWRVRWSTATPSCPH